MKNFCIAAIAFLLVFLSATPSMTAPLASRTVLDNGAVLLVAERPSIPMVVVNVMIKTGGVSDPVGKEGLANLTAELLMRGTKKHSAQALAEELDFLGASLGTDADYEVTTLSLTTLTKNLDQAMSLFAEVLLTSTFPQEELEQKKKEIEGGLKSREEQPGWVAQRAFLADLYPHHPYGRQVEGQPTTLAALAQADVKKFHQTYYRPNNAIIAFTGDVTQSQVSALLEKHLSEWKQAAIPEMTWPENAQLNATRVTIDRKVSQANIMLGHYGIARSNPDYYALLITNYILGARGTESRLMKRIREELGLVYQIGSNFSPRKRAGPFYIALQTKNESATQAIEESLQVLRQLIDQGLTQEELDAAKAYLINSFPLRLASNRDVASILPVLEFYDLGLDYPDRYADLIGQVTLEKIQSVAKTYLRPDQLLQVVVADLAAAGLEKTQ
jgi:zinc protease